MLFLIAALVFAAALGSHQFVFLGRAFRWSGSKDWESILQSVEAVNLEGIQVIATLFLSPTKDQLRIEPPVMWEMLGGVEGVSRMRENAKAMLALCIYADRWGEEGVLIAQLIRTDALNLNKAIRRLEWMAWLGLGKRQSHFALMEAAAHYCLIQRRLFSLYESAHIGRLPALQACLGRAYPD